MALLNPPSPPFFKGENGGISTGDLLKREMLRNKAAFFKKVKVSQIFDESQ
jgi:hypothetical protein